MERISIVNDEGKLVNINDDETNLSERRTLVLINDKTMKIKFSPDNQGNVNIIVEDKNFTGKKQLRKIEAKYLIDYLKEWIIK